MSLQFTIGLPRSGKSTFANKWADEKPRRVIISSDNIRLALTGKRYEPLAETMVFATKHVMIRAMLDRGFDVLVDGTHSTEISLMRIFEIDINAEPIIFDTRPEVCKSRADITGQSDLYPIIDRISTNLIRLGVWNVDQNKVHESIRLIKRKVQERNLYGKFE